MFPNFGSYPFVIGFDRIDKLIEQTKKSQTDNYPPYDVEKLDEKTFLLSLAVAGFFESEIEITMRENLLVINGLQSNKTSRNFLHKGIALRNFCRSFVIADNIFLQEAILKDGLLTVKLQQNNDSTEKKISL